MTDLREIGPTYYFAPPRDLREPADAGDDPHGGRERDQARAVPTTSWPSRASAAPRSSTARPCRSASASHYALGNVLVYGAAAQRARHEPRPRRLHGGRRDRPRSLPLLPLDRHQPEAALRLDRDLRVRVPAARRRREARRGRPAGAARRGRRSRADGEVLVRGPMLLKEYYKRPDATAESIDADGWFHTGDAGFFDAGRAAQDHRPREGRRQALERRDVRAQLHREQAQVLAARQGGGHVRRRARPRLRVHQHRHGLGRQLGGAARHSRTRATPISRRSPRCTRSSASASRR